MADSTGKVQKILEVKLNANPAIMGIMELNKQIEANQASMKKMAEATGKNTDSYIKLEQQTKALTAEKRVLQKEVQNEYKVQTEQEGSLKRLQAELRKVTYEFDRMGDKQRETTQRGKELKEEIDRLTTEIKKTEYATQRYYRNVGNYENAILNAIGLNGRFGSSIVNITNVSGGVQGAFTAMGQSAKAFGATLMGLMSNPVFLAIAGIAGVGMAFKWFYDYNEGLAEATRLTREFTGYSGDELLAMRNSIQATADVMGKDFKETLQTADTLMANFHITGEQAMDVINKGFASGADVNGDMLQKIQQYAPTFHDAGIEADQMVAIISQTKSGIFTDQGLDAIKMGSTRIREMSTSTKQALQGIGIDADAMSKKLAEGTMGTFDALKQVSAQLKTMPNDSQQVGEVMSAVFGRQGKFASQEMIESLATMSTSLDEVTAKTGEYGELLLENIDTEEELDNVTSALFDMTNNGWEEIKQQATIYAKKALVAVVKGIVDVVNWFVRLYNQSIIVRAGVQSIVTGWKMVWNGAKLAFNLIIDGFKAIGRGINAIVNAFNQAGKAISAFGHGVYDIFAGIANGSLAQIEKGWNTLKNGVSNAVKSSWDGIMGALKASWSETGADWASFGKEAGEIVMDSFKEVVSGQLKEVSIPAFAGGGGGGGSSSGGGGGNSTNTNSTGGGGGRNRGGGGKGKGGTNKGAGKNKPASQQTTKKEKTPEEIAYEAYIKRMEALTKKGEELHRKALEEEAKTSLEKIDELAELQIQELYKTYGEREQYEGEALKAWDRMYQEIEEKRKKAIEDYHANVKKTEAEQQKQARSDAQKLAELTLAGQKEGSAEQMAWRLKVLKLQNEAELAELDANERLKTQNKEMWEQMRTAITEKYRKEQTDIEKEYADKQHEIEMSKLTASAQVVGAMGQILESMGEENKEALAVSKMLALGEIMISQAVAIANAVRAGSNAVTPWQMIAQIATSIVAVTSAMAQAFKSLNEAKFATGGYVRGAGTGTSDSIPVRVSNGESIMNANTTAMFSGLLSSLNQLGGGVPIQAQQTASSVRGEDMLARAVAKGVAMLPAPVVSVEDINRGQRQVEVMNERATL